MKNLFTILSRHHNLTDRIASAKVGEEFRIEAHDFNVDFLKALTQLRFEVSIVRDKNKIVVIVGDEYEWAEEALKYEKNSQAMIHTHPVHGTKLPTIQDINDVERCHYLYNGQIRYFLFTSRGIVEYGMPSLEIIGEKDVRDFLADEARKAGLDENVDTTTEDGEREYRQFISGIGCIVQEVGWDDSAATNLIDEIRDLLFQKL